jgi:cell division protease FtsH
LGAIQNDGGPYSDETAKTIDGEIRRIIDDQYHIALQVLKDHRDLLEKTAARLLEDEVIDGSALAELASAVRAAQTPPADDLQVDTRSRDKAA